MFSPPTQHRCVVWFRGKDLRIRDHQALTTAVRRGGEVLPLFVVDPYFFDPVRCQELPHRIQFLLDSLHALDASLREQGTQLHIVRGSCHDVLPKVVSDWGATEGVLATMVGSSWPRTGPKSTTIVVHSLPSHGWRNLASSRFITQ